MDEKGCEIKKMKKALIVTTVSGFVPQFEKNNVKLLQEMGYEVHYAANYDTPVYDKDNKRLDKTGIVRHQVDFLRTPFSLKNKSVYRKLKKLMQREQFDLVHCHTPMGAVMARLAAKNTNTAPVIYTAHGFHFYKGAALLNWILYYPIERWLARYTDLLITMNREDYKRAKHFPIRKHGHVCYIPGIGIDVEGIGQVQINQEEMRNLFGIPKEAKLIVSVGELNKNKNHELVIRALSKRKEKNWYYLICGEGERREYLWQLCQTLQISDKVLLSGYQNDIYKILKMADLYVMPSIREGLSVSLMEAMAAGLPVAASRIRGNIDLVTEQKGGFLFDARSVNSCQKALEIILEKNELAAQMGQFNLNQIKKYSEKRVKKAMWVIYGEVSHKREKVNL